MLTGGGGCSKERKYQKWNSITRKIWGIYGKSLSVPLSFDLRDMYYYINNPSLIEGFVRNIFKDGGIYEIHTITTFRCTKFYWL